MISDLILYMLISVILLYMFYRWVTVHERYFVQRSMKFCSPKFLFGNTIGLFLKLYTPTDFVDSIYYRFPREKCVTIVFISIHLLVSTKDSYKVINSIKIV